MNDAIRTTLTMRWRLVPQASCHHCGALSGEPCLDGCKMRDVHDTKFEELKQRWLKGWRVAIQVEDRAAASPWISTTRGRSRTGSAAE